MNVGKITQSLSQNVSKLGNATCEGIKNNKKVDKVLKTIRPTGANNSFPALASLMTLFVIIPRVKTAATRNPDDKEATKDEIKEILFRDVQTVVIILFLLKIINTLAGALSTKKTGLPMLNQQFDKLFQKTPSDASFLEKTKSHWNEFEDAPKDVLKRLGKNILGVLNPTGGNIMLTNDEYVSKYSGFDSWEKVRKIGKNIDTKGGDQKKVANTVYDILTKELETSKKQSGLRAEEFKNDKLLETLKGIDRTAGFEAVEKIEDENTQNAIKGMIQNFFSDKDNALVRKAKGLNGELRLGALIFESTYLGFGLPALNQKRLEKKYLNKDGQSITQDSINQVDNISKTLVKTSIKPQEIKLYNSFIKKA